MVDTQGVGQVEATLRHTRWHHMRSTYIISSLLVGIKHEVSYTPIMNT